MTPQYTVIEGEIRIELTPIEALKTHEQAIAEVKSLHEQLMQFPMHFTTLKRAVDSQSHLIDVLVDSHDDNDYEAIRALLARMSESRKHFLENTTGKVKVH